MGFRSPGYRLKWPEGHELHGLEIRISGLSIGELEVVSGYREIEGASREEKQAATDEMISLFAAHLIEWNWEDANGDLVGITEKDVRTRDLRQLMPAIMAWIREVSSVPDPLPASSPSGLRSPEVSLPMDLPLPNLTSSPTPE